MLQIVNGVLVVAITLFLFQLLSELLFPDRGKFCRECDVHDLPATFDTCPLCSRTLTRFEETVGMAPRITAFGFPLVSLAIVAVTYWRLEVLGQAAHYLVLGHVVACAGFAQLWLPARDRRLRTMFNLPFWSPVAATGLVILFVVLSRQLVPEDSSGRGRLVTDMEVGTDGVPVLALRHGGLAHGVGPTAYPYFRDRMVRRLIRNGNGDVLVYIGGQKLTAPDAVVSATGVDFAPSPERVEEGFRILLGARSLTPSQRQTLEQAASHRNVHFCSSEDRLWVTDGGRLMRTGARDELSTFSLGRREVGELLKVACVEDGVWLLAAKGLLFISASTDRKLYFPLIEFVAHDPGDSPEIVAGSLDPPIAWLATSLGDVFRFDLEKQELAYAGRADCPVYLDFYNLYTLPILLFALLWMLRANFQKEED